MRASLMIVVGLLGGLCGTAGGAEKPNVLFLICDDLNCNLGCYGHPLVKTPNIDKLAARGMRFERAYCQYPLCGPSRASFMSGLYPDQTLIQRNAIYLREHVPDVVTLSQTFRSGGYFATRIGKIYHYGVPRHIGTSGHDDPYSWDYTINPRGRDKDEEDLIFSLSKREFGGTMSWLASAGSDEEMTDGVAATEAVQLLEQYAAQGKQFYLAVGLYRPHTPYVAPRTYYEMYPTDKIRVPQVPAGYLDTLPKPAQQTLVRKRDQVDLADNLARQAIQGYYAAISFADAQLGRILDALDAHGLSNNTIVLFTSDHGYHMGEHNYYQKTTLFENAARVPLIIAGPGIKAGQSTLAPAEMVDFYPTLAELAGLAVPPCLSGVSLVPVLKDPEARPRDAALTQFADGYSLRTPRYRYTEWGENGGEGAELYDHDNDPEEMVNLARDGQHADVIATLSKQIRERIAEARRPPEGVQQIRFDDSRRLPPG